MSKQSFHVSGRYLGSRTIDEFARWHNESPLQVVWSQYYWCPYCGELWGQVLHEHSRAPRMLENRPCLVHTTPGVLNSCAGSLAANPYWGWNPIAFDADWPDGAVEHEFLAALRRVP